MITYNNFNETDNLINNNTTQHNTTQHNMFDTTKYPKISTRNVDKIKKSLDDPLDLKVWSNTWKVSDDNDMYAISTLLLTNSVFFEGKLIRTRFTRTGWGLNIKFLSYSNTSCFEFDISLPDKVGCPGSLLPYGTGCPIEVTARMYLAMCDLLCVGLRVRHRLLYDNATVNLFGGRATSYVKTGRACDQYMVPLTIVNMIRKGQPYYEQYGYMPRHDDDRKKLNELKVILAQDIRTMSDIPSDLIRFVGPRAGARKYNYSTYGEFLNAFLEEKERRTPSTNARNLITLIFRNMPRPSEFIKKYDLPLLREKKNDRISRLIRSL